MFTGTPIFVRFRQYGRQATGSHWGFLLAPGLLLMLFGLAILIWPDLLAYLVAGVLLFAGLSMTLWALSLRRLDASRRSSADDRVEYRVM